MSTLYVVATPIGNLEDITLRALRVLKEVDFVFCEDTRVAKKLMDHFGIGTKRESYHSRSGLSKIEYAASLLNVGKNIALISDAGTPAVSDPGSVLVAAVRERCKETKIVAIPGASALTAFISFAGKPLHEFTFLGFFPNKKGRKTLFLEMQKAKRPFIFYESPHRIIKTLESLADHIPLRKIVIGRELTKIFEEILEGNPKEILQYFNSNREKIRGELVVAVLP